MCTQPNVHSEGRAACGASLSTVLLGLIATRHQTKAERLNAPAPPVNPNALREIASKDAELKQRQQQRADAEEN